MPGRSSPWPRFSRVSDERVGSPSRAPLSRSCSPAAEPSSSAPPRRNGPRGSPGPNGTPSSAASKTEKFDDLTPEQTAAPPAKQVYRGASLGSAGEDRVGAIHSAFTTSTGSRLLAQAPPEVSTIARASCSWRPPSSSRPSPVVTVNWAGLPILALVAATHCAHPLPVEVEDHGLAWPMDSARSALGPCR